MISDIPSHDDDELAQGRGDETPTPFDELDLEKKWLHRSKIDLDNFAFFYDRYYPVIFKYIYLRTADKETTNDVTNETFSRALSSLGKFRWQGYTVGAWLFQIARRVLYKEHHDATRRAEVPFEPAKHEGIESRTPEQELEKLEDEEILRRCVRQLDPVRQDVFVMHYWLELGTAAVAAAMAIPEGTVKSHLQRGRRELLASLKKHGVVDGLSQSMMGAVRKADAKAGGWTLLNKAEETSDQTGGGGDDDR